MNKCLVCGNKIWTFMSFGKMPLANGFLSEKEFDNEYSFMLEVAFCSHCKMVQLVEQPDPEKMFHENYAFFSSTSTRMMSHFKQFAEYVIWDYLQDRDPFVVEIGSNDGIMLKNFAGKGIRHLGIEPSANVANVAINNGINTINKFFDEDVAKDIVKKHGKVDAFLGANVMCHIPNLNSIIAGIKTLLKPNGIVMFEDPYIGDILEKTSYDQIYDEHVFLFSASSIKYAFAQHDLELIDIEAQPTHGGSMRYVLAHKNMRQVSKNVSRQIEQEENLALNNPDTYELFRKRCERSRNDLITLLKKIKKEGKRVVGYAATSKSTTIINYCSITPDLIEFISDTTPIKQGKFSPGMHIPVRPYEDFRKRYPDYAMLFAWNHEAEVMAKEENFRKASGKFILYVPQVHIK